MASKKNGMKIAETVGAGAVLAAAAGYYFYGTKNAKKHRQAASAWAKGMKKDVEKQVASLRKVDAKSVAKIVDEASKRYHKAKGVSLQDVHAAAKELKSNWKTIQKELEPSRNVKRTVRTVKKAVTGAASAKKKVTKVAKKAVKKAKSKATKR